MIQENIREFIDRQSCATICCVDSEPYCFSCFYAIHPRQGLLYFKSSASSVHISMMKNNPVVAGTILPDKPSNLFIQGLQFKGIAAGPEDPLTKHASWYYYKKLPVALVMPGELWTIQLLEIKMTDSGKGIIRKYTWSRSEEVEEVKSSV
jgi:uncharacterized protein YhbP (UPF0306 family)